MGGAHTRCRSPQGRQHRHERRVAAAVLWVGEDRRNERWDEGGALVDHHGSRRDVCCGAVKGRRIGENSQKETGEAGAKGREGACGRAKDVPTMARTPAASQASMYDCGDSLDALSTASSPLRAASTTFAPRLARSMGGGMPSRFGWKRVPASAARRNSSD